MSKLAPNMSKEAQLIWSLILGVFSFLSCCIFVARRNLYPVKGRQVKLALLTAFFMSFHMITRSAMKVLDAPCEIIFFGLFWLLNCLATCYEVRAFVLFFRFELTHEMIRQRSASEKHDRFHKRARSLEQFGRRGGMRSKTDDDDEANYYFNRRHWISSQMVLLVSIVLMGSYAVIGGIIAIAPIDDDYCESQGVIEVLFMVFFFVHCIVVGLLGWRVRGVVDGYYVKQELRIAMLLGFLGLVFLALAPADTSPSFFGSGFGPMVLLHVNLLLWPVYRTYVVEFRPEHQSRQSIDTFDELLKSDLGLAAFREFVTREFSVENLTFYLAVEDFRKFIRGEILQHDISPSRSPSASARSLKENSLNPGHRVSDEFSFSSPRRPSPRNLPLPEAISLLEMPPSSPRRSSDISNVSSDTEVVLSRDSREFIAAEDIYYDFIHPDGHFMVNLPAQMFTDITEVIEPPEDEEQAMGVKREVLEHLYDAAQHEIHRLMQRDTFVRFSTSRLYEKLLDDISKHNKTVDVFELVTGRDDAPAVAAAAASRSTKQLRVDTNT